MVIRKVAVVTAAATVVAAFGLAGSALARDDKFNTRLSGAEEAPGPGDPDGSGKAKLTIDAAAGEVCFKVDWKDIGTPTAGHIHVGAPGVPGPIVVDLLGGFSPDELERDDKVRACVPGDPEVLDQILADPAGYYVNVHNARFPAGAIRGQLDD